MRTKAVVFGFVALSLLLLSCHSAGERRYWPSEEWRERSPNQQGLNAAKLAEMDSYIRSTLPLTSSVVIVRHGYIVFEEYYSGFMDSKRNLYSITKSVVSALVGVAIKEAYVQSVDQKMIDFFPEGTDQALNPYANEITIRHLLSMSDGISSDTNQGNFLFRIDMLSKDFRHEPGTQFFYNSISPQVLSIIITKMTGMTALDFGKKYVFGPMGMTDVYWSEDLGYSRAAWGMMITSRDMAKLGYLYLNKGNWNGKQLVPQDWVSESTRAQIKTGEAPDYWDTYGLYWWVRSFAGHSAFFAFGSGGQSISVIPDADLVVVVTTQDIVDEGAEKYLAIVDDYIMPAVER